jgi:hypothetical protein
MQKYNVVNYYEYPVDVVCQVLMETPNIYNLADLPNVSTNQQLEDRDAGDKKYIKVKWDVQGQLPPIVQKVVKPNMLTFVEDSVWDRRTRVYSTKILPSFFKNVIDAHHQLEFTEEKGRTKRLLRGHFEFKVPVVGPIFEGLVVNLLKQNIEADFKLSTKALVQYIEKNGVPEITYRKF